MSGLTSKRNGKLGGRPKNTSTIKNEQARNVLAQMVCEEIIPLGKQLIKQAKKGNILAMKELFDRAFGRSSQSFEVTNTLSINQLLDQAEKK